MAETYPTDRALSDPAAEDAKAERAVLAFLLDEHPAQLTIPELSLALNAHPGSFESEDAVERAVRELVGAGLLRCQGGFVVPTRAALYVERLAPFG
jgi:hypothetical protein